MVFTPDELLKAQKQLMQKKSQQRNLHQESKSLFSAEKLRRQQVGRGDVGQIQPVFLRPQDIQKGVDYDVQKVYLTTLGGTKRFLTRADLIAFSENIELLQDQYKKGITAKQVIDLSLDIDIERSNKQIYLAQPLSQKNGVVRFMTNASGENKETEHYVNVQFLAYQSLVLAPVAISTQDIKKKLCYGKLKFECSCGRHTFWYRYVASVGGYGYGRIEEGYPKEKNPNLAGVACKHALRVMSKIISPSFLAYIEKQLKKERSSQSGLLQKTSSSVLQKEMLAQADQQQKAMIRNQKKAQQELLRRSDRLAKKQQAKIDQQRKSELAKIEKQQGKEAMIRAQNQQKQDDINTLRALLRMGQISQEQFNRFSKGVD